MMVVNMKRGYSLLVCLYSKFYPLPCSECQCRLHLNSVGWFLVRSKHWNRYLFWVICSSSIAYEDTASIPWSIFECLKETPSCSCDNKRLPPEYGMTSQSFSRRAWENKNLNHPWRNNRAQHGTAFEACHTHKVNHFDLYDIDCHKVKLV